MTAPPLPDLPVRDALGALGDALSAGRSAILIAPPGAGKTTLVAPALLDAGWLQGRLIQLLLPRRLAARAAAERIAALLGEEVGRRVGYRTRLESRIGPACRILCATHGVFTNRITADPEMADTGLVLFDEVHERGLESDLALALALDVQGALRPDLRLVAMSATIDGAAFARLMDDAAVVESSGRAWPIAVHHVGRPRPNERLEQAVARIVGQAMAGHDGSLLAFLPGVAEIARVAELLCLPPDIAVHRLHGTADPAAQRAAIMPAAARKCVLATAIAETSLTIDGVRLVVDAGLARRPRRDPASGFVRLATVRVSAAAAVQRAGRAGRQAPGIVWRLWEPAETAGLAAQDMPEILAADLASLLLRLAAFGVRDPASLRWLDPPPPDAVSVARRHLHMLGAIDADGSLAPHGRAMGQLPVAPALAHMMLEGAGHGAAELAARIAVLIEEPGGGPLSVDLDERLARLARDRGHRADAARQLARRWAGRAEALVRAPVDPVPLSPALLLASAFPDRVARRRRLPAASDRTVAYLLAGGGGALIDAAEPLAASEWLVVADAGGAGANARIRLAAALGPECLGRWLKDHERHSAVTAVDPASGRVVAETVHSLGAITVSRHRLARPGREQCTAALLAAVRSAGPGSLPWSDAERATRARLAFARAHGLAGVPPMEDAALLRRLEDWLAPRLADVDRIADARLDGALLALLDRQTARTLETFAPMRLATPAGTSHAIDYGADGGPVAEVRVQALFGMAHHPLLADGRVKLRLALTSPAGRPIAMTSDLPGFWRTGWPDVRRDMKGRYPRHPWPEDPMTAAPTIRTSARMRP